MVKLIDFQKFSDQSFVKSDSFHQQKDREVLAESTLMLAACIISPLIGRSINQAGDLLLLILILNSIQTYLLISSVPNKYHQNFKIKSVGQSSPSRLPCYVFCIFLLTTNKNQKYKSAELGNQLRQPKIEVENPR